MTEAGDTGRPEAELQKLRLEIQKLTLDVAGARKFARLDVALRLMPTATILVTVLGFMFTVWQYRTEQAKNRLASEQQAGKEAAERAERARKDTETAQREFMRPLLEKQQELYFEAATAAATIVSTRDAAERRKAEGKFWILYRGPLVMVESTDVSGAMKKFGRCLTGEDPCDAGELNDRSLALASTLETSMLKTWNAKPDEFIKGQFVYR
jgi:hypothetical protein